MNSCTRAAVVVVGMTAIIATTPASGQQFTGEARNMELIGHHDLQARSAYQPVVREQNGRWIAYIGHHGGTERAAKPVNALTGKPEFNGTSVLDVTDPRAPRYLAHIPGEEGQGESGGAPVELHGPISTGPAGNRVYFGYGTNKDGIVQIVDRQKLLSGPAEPTTANLQFPEVGRLTLPSNVGAHTAFPLLKMDVAEF